MKRMVTLMAVGMVAVSVVAQAAELENGRLHTTYQAQLTRFELDPAVTSGRAQSGSVEVNMLLKEATLNLQLGFYCPRGRVCAQVMPAPISVTLPILSRGSDTCGTMIVIAKRRTPAGLEQLEIRDNTKNVCPHFAQLADTEVIYTTESAAPAVKTRSVFSGGRLEKFTDTVLETQPFTL